MARSPAPDWRMIRKRQATRPHGRTLTIRNLIERSVRETGLAPTDETLARILATPVSRVRHHRLCWGCDMPRPRRFPPKKQAYQIMRGSRNGNSKLKEPQVVAIRASYRLGQSADMLAETHGVHVSTVYQIVGNRTWRGVEQAEQSATHRVLAGDRALRVGDGRHLHIGARP
jgi:hypothetical protein